MYYSAIKWNDIANGKGIRISLFVSGCTRHCKGCFNAETWAFNAGKRYTDTIQLSIIKDAKRGEISGLSVLGGEPLHPKNAPAVARLCEQFKRTYPNKDIWIYTGYTFEELLKEDNTFVIYAMHDADVLVDGEFVQELKDITLKFRGSSNQRIIDLKQSMIHGVAVLA